MIAKLALWALGLVAVLFIAAIALLSIFQRSLIYPIPVDDGDVPPGFEVVSYTTPDGLELEAGFRPGREGLPVLLFFHGNGVDWQSITHTAELAMKEGYGVLAAEYRGYGGNPGAPHEDGLYNDGRAAWSYLREQGFAADDIVILGNSLGSGTATQVAMEQAPRALILISPFKSLAATAQNSYPWAPVDMMLKDRYDSIDKIGAVEAPILILHGEDDRLIPIEHARELAQANPNAQFIGFTGEGHALSPEDTAQEAQLAFLAALAE